MKLVDIRGQQEINKKVILTDPDENMSTDVSFSKLVSSSKEHVFDFDCLKLSLLLIKLKVIKIHSLKIFWTICLDLLLEQC